jgi:hypothetical protein
MVLAKKHLTSGFRVWNTESAVAEIDETLSNREVLVMLRILDDWLEEGVVSIGLSNLLNDSVIQFVRGNRKRIEFCLCVRVAGQCIGSPVRDSRNVLDIEVKVGEEI